MTVDIWERYKKIKSVELRNEIAENYLSLIRIICGRIALNLPSYVDKDDLLSSGFFGLLDAIERFDPKRNIQFETYASLRIRGAMIDYLRSQDWISVSLRQRLNKYERAIAVLESQLGRFPTDHEIAKELNTSIEEVRNLDDQYNFVTLMPFEDYLSCKAPDLIENINIKESLAKMISHLSEKEKFIVALYYNDGLTLKEIGKILNLTEARISQLHKHALLKLRSSFIKF